MIRGRAVTRVLPLLLLAGATHVPAGCACTDELLPSVNVRVRDQAGQPAALGASGSATHQGGTRTPLMGWDSLLLGANWARERDGRYTIEVRKPGFKTATARTEVDDGMCHVKTRTLTIRLEPEPAAVRLTPVTFLQGGQVRGVPVSTGVRVVGDTLEIVGNAGFRCDVGMTTTAYRAGGYWHIQIEPENWATLRTPCTGAPHQLPFELKYILPQGRTELMVTTGLGYPDPVLFHSDVVR